MRPQIDVLSDKNLFGMAELLEAHKYNAFWFEGEKGLSSAIHNDVDALIVRTVTKITPTSLSLLPKLKALVSASAGTDHVDKELLKNKGVFFDNASGSNARSVAEYVVTAILKIVEIEKRPLNSLKVGIIGVGAVGTTLAKLLAALEIETILYDPPKSTRDNSFVSATTDDLKEADILSFHTPLTMSGLDSTYHMFSNQHFWKDAEVSFLAVINAARGGVLNEHTLLKMKHSGAISYLVTDVWEGEPVYNSDFRKECLIATPHIAGYSVQAKFRASWQCLVSLNNFFNKKTEEDFNYWFKKLSTKASIKAFTLNDTATRTLSNYDILKQVNPIEEYHAKMGQLDSASDQQKMIQFGQLRVQESLRDEYAYIKFDENILTTYPLVRVLQA
jgi:erythronate-4-phosphate dehydrogenase